MLKLLQTGSALRSIEELRKQGLIGKRQGCSRSSTSCWRTAGRMRRFVQLALATRPARRHDKPVAPSFLSPACSGTTSGRGRGSRLGRAPFRRLQQAVDAVFEPASADISAAGKLGPTCARSG